MLRFVAIYARFGIHWAKAVFLGQGELHKMEYIAYHTELNFQNMRKNAAFVTKMTNT